MSIEDLIAQAVTFATNARKRLQVAHESARTDDQRAELEMALRELALALGRVADAIERS